MINDPHYRPVFVVGHPRSGTTLLATVLGRNSNLAMPPETQFLIEQAPFDRPSLSRDDLEKILDNPRISDLGLNRSEVQTLFKTSDHSFGAAFWAIIETYRQAQGAARAGEKSPLHLLHVCRLLEWFPQAKIVCIERNAPDVIASLMRMPWSHSKINLHAFDWNRSVDHAHSLLLQHPERFTLVRYEDFLKAPEAETRRICAFCDLPFQPEMLTGTQSATVPEWEKGWKSGVESTIQPQASSKAGSLSRWHKARIAAFSNKTLVSAGYTALEVRWYEWLVAWLSGWPYLPRVRPIFKWAATRIRMHNK